MPPEDPLPHREFEHPSDRAFGFALSAFALTVGLWPLGAGGTVRTWSIAASLVAAALAIAQPHALAHLNRAWTRIGRLIGLVAAHFSLGLVYLAVVTPTGIAMRKLGKDPLRLRSDPDAVSYWIPRDPPGPPPESLPRQY